jgi:hypothetical protein
MLMGLTVLFVIAGPTAAVGGAQVARSSVLRQAQGERAWRQATAILVQPPSRRLKMSSDGWVMLSARAHWTADGRVRAGWIPVTPAAGRGGKRVVVWIHADGSLAGPPSALANLYLEMGLAGISAPLVLACILVLVGAAGRCLLDRRRMAEWERAWAAIGPDWSRPL